MPTETHEFDCFDFSNSDIVPPPHMWMCCGFQDTPTSLTVTWALSGVLPDSGVTIGDCEALYGTGEHTSVLTRQRCGTEYSNPDVPFYIAINFPAYCQQDPRGAGNNNIGIFVYGPGSPTPDGGNYCQQDPDTGEITFVLCATNIGSSCLFSACVRMP